MKRLLNPSRATRSLVSAVAGPSTSRLPPLTPRRPLSTSPSCCNTGGSSSRSGNSSSAQSRADSLTSIGAPVWVRKNQNQQQGNTSASSKDKGPVRDEDIQSDQIFLVDFTGAAGGGLTGPFPTSAVLGKIDRKRFWLQQVSAASSPAKPAGTDGGEQPSPQYPVCKLISKKEDYDKARAAARKKAGKTDEEPDSELPASSQEAQPAPAAAAPKPASSSSAPSRKEVQLTWSSTAHDISYKIAKAKRDLLKGGPGSRLTVRISHKGNAGRDVGPPGSPSYLATQTKRKEFLKTLHHLICQNEEDGAATAAQEEDAEAVSVEESMMKHRGAGGASVPGGVARISTEGVQWKTHGHMAVMAYEQVPQK
ncbi:hypothetical protein OC846_002669 [Tilletia horrida]|uniref:Uncharacterized protein n=1 Tax=Tilletia horrida TaxID=155126 RepID=A0AAN6JRY3_9BASI|nr:hypothetical protein OC845_002401 [Tilletia horrida]KAK0553053.1 hypothetical protein OC846_002669 [Tilletia horrida]KAK0569709.1 hypothetical protein OC861_000671 [Tilletia horrida]